MALLSSRVLFNSRRQLSVSATRLADKMMADPLEHATGKEKRELLAQLAGNDVFLDWMDHEKQAALDIKNAKCLEGLLEARNKVIPVANVDPYHTKAIKRMSTSTKENPNLVPSAFDSRIVGCICEEDATHIKWMWVYKGIPGRCACGHWFKLVEKPPL